MTPNICKSRINAIINVRYTLILLKQIVEILNSSKNPLLYKKYYISKIINNSFDDPKIIQIINNINTIFEENVLNNTLNIQNHEQICFALKNGINGTLDIARANYCSIVDDINNLVDLYKEKCIFLIINSKFR